MDLMLTKLISPKLNLLIEKALLVRKIMVPFLDIFFESMYIEHTPCYV